MSFFSLFTLPESFRIVETTALTRTTLEFISLDVFFKSLHLSSKVPILPLENGAVRPPPGAHEPLKSASPDMVPIQAPQVDF